jgi:hypothetical protein
MAHHGRDFLLVEDTHLPAPGSVQALLNFEWERTGSTNEYGVEPGLLFGVMPHLALGLETSFRDEGEGWDYANVTPKLHVLLTPDSAKLPFRAALSVGYQFAKGAAEEHEAEAEEGEEEEHHHHEFSGIHNHDSDLLSLRLAVETKLTDSTTLAANLISILPDGDSVKWGYAVGVRQALGSGVSVGVEALGDFDSEGWQEITGAVYYEPTCNCVFKLGAGFGLTDNTPDFMLRFGTVYRF